MINRITNKHMRNKRFRETEEAIFRAFFDGKKNEKVKRISEKAEISRSTFYRHHQAAYSVISDYENCILGEFKGMIEKLPMKQGEARIHYYVTLGFIVRHKKAFKFLINSGNIAEKMVRMVEKIVGRNKKLPKNYSKVFRVYTKEIAGVIEEWGERGFRRSEIEIIIKDIMYLKKTARQRLAPLLN